MTVRAKFTVQEHRTTSYNPQSKTVILRPQYDTTTPEDQRYAKATPSGELTMQIDNPPALAEFELGRTFYVDFTPAE